MIAKMLVDTNVLVYAYDPSDPEKQERAFMVLDGLATSGQGALSAQVLAEFVVVVTQKIAEPLDLKVAQKRVENYLSSWTVLDITGFVVLEAMRGVHDHHFAYWDAQIWATAKLAQIPFILSEDFSSGNTVEGINFVNPFVADFDLFQFI
ncbi:MAG: PIN domain-containing protein [Actinomycetota bacterium]